MTLVVEKMLCMVEVFIEGRDFVIKAGHLIVKEIT
jgi:hypothetical protein